MHKNRGISAPSNPHFCGKQSRSPDLICLLFPGAAGPLRLPLLQTSRFAAIQSRCDPKYGAGVAQGRSSRRASRGFGAYAPTPIATSPGVAGPPLRGTLRGRRAAPCTGRFGFRRRACGEGQGDRQGRYPPPAAAKEPLRVWRAQRPFISDRLRCFRGSIATIF